MNKLKRNCNLYLDIDLIEVAKIKGINISDVVNSLLRQHLEYNEPDSHKIEKELVEAKKQVDLATVRLKEIEKIKKKDDSKWIHVPEGGTRGH